MKRHGLRQGLFGLGAAGLAALFAIAFIHLPGPHLSTYGRDVNRLAQPQRHVTDAVTAVNFDYRGFDTLGEEFILFVSVMGAAVLLRQTQEKKHEQLMDAIHPRRSVGPTDAMRAWTLGMTGPTVLFGVYVVIHGQLTPGGGFQGGVILATAPLLIYLVENFDVFKRITNDRALEIMEAVGVGGFAAIGVVGWIAGGWFLRNVFPLGSLNSPDVLSGGTVAAIDLATGLAVAAGFTLLLGTFLQEVLASEEGS